MFQRDKSVISRHLNNVFKEGELQKQSVVVKNATTAKDGKTYQVDYYNLDVIISIGYRIKSQRGTQFRIWSNKILKEYLIKGFSINERRLKQKTEQLIELQESVKILGGIPDMVQNGKNGFLCKEISSSSLAKTIEKAMQYSFNREYIVQDSNDRYSLKKQANSYINLYKSLI